MAMRCCIPLWAAVVAALTGAVAAAEPAATYVRPIDMEALNQKVRALPAEQRERVALYMEAARRTVLDVTDGCFPDNSFREHGRNLAERAKGLRRWTNSSRVVRISLPCSALAKTTGESPPSMTSA